MGNLPSKIFTVQYTTSITDQAHKDLTEAVEWLFQTKRIPKKSKYFVTRFALKNIVEFVNFKKAKVNGDNIDVKNVPSNESVTITDAGTKVDAGATIVASTSTGTKTETINPKEPLKQEAKPNGP